MNLRLSINVIFITCLNYNLLATDLNSDSRAEETTPKTTLTGDIILLEDVEGLNPNTSAVLELNPNFQSENSLTPVTGPSPAIFIFSGSDLKDKEKGKERILPRKKSPKKRAPANQVMMDSLSVHRASQLTTIEAEPDQSEFSKMTMKEVIFPNEVYFNILSFLASGPNWKGFLNYRLVDKRFNDLVKITPCALALQWRLDSRNFDPEKLEQLRYLLTFNIEGLALKDFPKKEIIFDDIGKLSKLRFLDLTKSLLIDDSMFFYLKKLNKLEIVLLNGLKITDKAISYFQNLEKLKRISLEETLVTTKVFSYLKNSQGLSTVELNKNSKPNNTPYFPAEFQDVANLLSLNCLDLTSNLIRSTELKYLSNLSCLRTLRLANTNITDDGLEYISDLPQLQDLNLGYTRITFEGLRSRILEGGFKNLADIAMNGIKINNSNLLFLTNLDNLKRIYLKSTDTRIQTILEYYEHKSGIKRDSIKGYKVLFTPESLILSAGIQKTVKPPVRKYFLKEIAKSVEEAQSDDNQSDKVYVESDEENFRINDEDRKSYYQQLTGIEMFL